MDDTRAQDPALAEYNRLWDIWQSASDSLYRAKQMGALGGPELAKLEVETVEAKQRLDDWATANQWDVRPEVDPEEEAKRAALRASQKAAERWRND